MAKPSGSAGGGSSSAFLQAVARASNPAGTPGGVPGLTGQNVEAAYNSGYIADDSFMGPGRLGQGLSSNVGSQAWNDQSTISSWEIDSFKTAADQEAFEDLQAEYEARAQALASLGLGPEDVASRWYNPKDQDEYEGKGVEAPGQAAGLTDVPTSTTNFSRPRTVAAGWKEDEDDYQVGTLTVVFRDGTPYNFYKVPRSVWIKFHQSISKGRPFLNTTFPSTYAHGPADVSALSESMRDAVYMAARTTQLYYRSPATGKGHYQTRYTTKVKPGAKDNVVRYNADGTAVVKVRTRTLGSPQNPTKANPNPKINKQNAKASKPTPRNTSAQRKK